MKYIYIILYGLTSFLLGAWVMWTFAAPQSQITSVSASVERVPLEITQNEPVMTIEWVSDEQTVLNMITEYSEQTGKFITGLSLKVNQKCIVYAYEPKYENDRNMQVLGHEVMHCFRGKLHE